MTKSFGYAVKSSTSAFEPFFFERRDVGGKDVQIEILYCGICHSDMHKVHNDWNNSFYPMVPGHEIVGKVTKVGKDVTKFKKDDLVGVGVIIDSCQNCLSCKEGLEQYCGNGATSTFNSRNKITGQITFGGYSNKLPRSKLRGNLFDYINRFFDLPPSICATSKKPVPLG